jgi:hypothetical protein
MSLRIREFPDRGVLVWAALTLGIAAWVLHLTVFAALVEFVHDNGYAWIFTVGNAVTIAVALVALALSWLIFRAGHDDDGAGTPAGRMRFLGALALMINAVNLLLIVVEGSYVYFIGTGHG